MSVSVDTITEKLFDNFKKITPALIAVATFTGLLLFLPVSVLEKMSLHQLPELWKQIFGIIFLLSIALIATIVVFGCCSKVMEKRKNNHIKQNLRKKLKSLSPRQKRIVLQLLQSEDKSIILDKNAGDTIYLLNNLFLHQPEQVVSVGWNNEMNMVYVPQLWLMDLFNEEPELFA